MATAPPRYEPKPRFAHCSALVEGKWISYGGHFGVDGGAADPPTSVDVFDVNSEMWEQLSTTGTPPPGVIGAACTAVGSKLYHFGGFDDKQHYNVLHCLDTKTKVWSSITPNNPEASPMMKGALAVTSYNKLIVFIGGYGDIPANRHQAVNYVANPESEGKDWTNEVVCYDTEQNMWLRPTIAGTQPPPCSDMSLTKVDSHRAVMFGGGGEGNELISPDVYILDMLHWIIREFGHRMRKKIVVEIIMARVGATDNTTRKKSTGFRTSSLKEESEELPEGVSRMQYNKYKLLGHALLCKES